MCGITGVWTSGVMAPGGIAQDMLSTLRHRGPDGIGTWISAERGVSLGHARLSIVDLSTHGHQPMHSRSGRYVIVLNGEIYNHMELRELLGVNFPWRGHSDTETLLEAIDQWGLVKALELSVGMFAFGLWDRHEQTLSLARDRLGEKPLYYSQYANHLIFASELKALNRCPNIDFTLDEDAIKKYFEFGYIPTPFSIYRRIKKILPGTVSTWTSLDAEASVIEYWKLPIPTIQSEESTIEKGDGFWLEQLNHLLDRSIRLQMLSDVPLGAFLSGGIDSSLIVALMQRASLHPIRTFSMGIRDHGEDESSHSRKVAAFLGTDHTEMMVTPDDVLSVIPKLTGIYDEPFADASQVPTVLLSHLTRQHVTVALSGDAGDELFGGYNRYVTAARLESVMKAIPVEIRRVVAGLLHCVPSQLLEDVFSNPAARRIMHLPHSMGEKVSRLAGFLSASSSQEAYASLVSQWLSQSKNPLHSPYIMQKLADMPGIALPQKMMWWDMQTYLPDDILVKIDRAAMASSLETRVPFLDHRVIEFSMNIPMKYKIRGGKSKWLLRQLLANHLPINLFERPKQGFTLPLAQWLRGPLRDWAEDLLSPQKLNSSGLLQADLVQELWSEHLSGQCNHQRGLWTVLMFQAWMDTRGSVQNT